MLSVRLITRSQCASRSANPGNLTEIKLGMRSEVTESSCRHLNLFHFSITSVYATDEINNVRRTVYDSRFS